MEMKVFKNGELLNTFKTGVAESLLDSIYISIGSRTYKLKEKPNYTDKMVVELHFKEYDFENNEIKYIYRYENVPCKLNMIDIRKVIEHITKEN